MKPRIWKATQKDHFTIIIQEVSPNETFHFGVAEVFTGDINNIGYKKGNENARLIAAAPAMYESLKKAKQALKIANKYDKGYTCEGAIEEIEAILNSIDK